MRNARFLLGVFAILCLFAVASTTPAYADSQSVLHPTVVGQVGGVTNAVAYYDNYLFFNVGPRLASMALSSAQPGQPFKPERYGPTLPGVPQDIKVANGYLYLALGNAGVAVVNPGTLGIVGYVALPENAQGDSAKLNTAIANFPGLLPSIGHIRRGKPWRAREQSWNLWPDTGWAFAITLNNGRETAGPSTRGRCARSVSLMCGSATSPGAISNPNQER